MYRGAEPLQIAWNTKQFNQSIQIIPNILEAEHTSQKSSVRK
jgi:hypothetical protein